MAPTPGIERLLASARATNTLPEVEPGTVIVTRLWPLGVGTVITGGIAFLVPQPAAIAAGYALGVALTWRRQASAVQAIEDRDGVRFHLDRARRSGRRSWCGPRGRARSSRSAQGSVDVQEIGTMPISWHAIS